MRSNPPDYRLDAGLGGFGQYGPRINDHQQVSVDQGGMNAQCAICVDFDLRCGFPRFFGRCSLSVLYQLDATCAPAFIFSTLAVDHDVLAATSECDLPCRLS